MASCTRARPSGCSEVEAPLRRARAAVPCACRRPAVRRVGAGGQAGPVERGAGALRHPAQHLAGRVRAGGLRAGKEAPARLQCVNQQRSCLRGWAKACTTPRPRVHSRRDVLSPTGQEIKVTRRLKRNFNDIHHVSARLGARATQGQSSTHTVTPLTATRSATSPHLPWWEPQDDLGDHGSVDHHAPKVKNINVRARSAPHGVLLGCVQQNSAQGGPKPRRARLAQVSRAR